MSYTVTPQVIKASAPTAADDSTRGFVVGSMWVDTTPSPDAIYICTSAAAGAATWVNAGGVTAHPSLSTLGWSASGHTGTTNSVACFSNTGAALTAQATVDGTVLTFSGGTLQFLAMAATIAFLDSKTLDIQYAPAGADVIPAATAAVVTGAYV
jgi:hypothetical protein